MLETMKHIVGTQCFVVIKVVVVAVDFADICKNNSHLYSISFCVCLTNHFSCTV